MAPKKAKMYSSMSSKARTLSFLISLGGLAAQLVCKFYLHLARFIGDELHAALQLTSNMILEVIKIVVVLIARVFSEICFGAALVVERTFATILQLLLQLILRFGRFMIQAAEGLVDQAGYGCSSIVFIIMTFLLGRCIKLLVASIIYTIVNLSW